MTAILRTLLTVCLATATTVVAQSPLSIVAAENFYGEVARRIAGPSADVTSILANPSQAPPPTCSRRARRPRERSAGPTS